MNLATSFPTAGNNGEATGWPDIKPLPPEHPPVAPFDYDLLPDAFMPYVRDVAERMQCPPDYVAVGLMTAAGTVLGKKIGIHPKRKDDWLEVCNLWAMIVGLPSVMKTPALMESLYPLNVIARECEARYAEECAKFEIAKAVRDAGRKDRANELAAVLKERGEAAAQDLVASQSDALLEPKRERLYVNDATVEKLGSILSENTNGVLQYRDELAGWLKSMEKSGHENDRAFFLECWNGKGAYTTDRIGRGTQFIQNAIVGVLGGIQPGVLSQYIREATSGGSGSDGLLQRFNLAVWPEVAAQFINIDRYPDKDAKAEVMAVFRRLRTMKADDMGATLGEYSTIPTLRFNDEAQDAFDGWRVTFEHWLRSSDEHPAFVSHLAKHRKAVPVLALICHLCDGGIGAVGLPALEKALRWHEYLKSHAAKIYGGLGNAGASPARELLRRIKDGDIKDGFTARSITQRHLSGLDGVETVQSGIDALLAANVLREERVEQPGRPLILHRINPAALSQKEVSKLSKGCSHEGFEPFEPSSLSAPVENDPGDWL